MIWTELYEQALMYEKGSFITSTGALATLSGAKTGRSPKDKRVVRDETTENELWWGEYVSAILHFPCDIEGKVRTCLHLIIECSVFQFLSL